VRRRLPHLAITLASIRHLHSTARNQRQFMAQAVKTRVDAPNPRGEKYQRILDAAICVIAEKGFFQARVAEIAERAGVADGTIYLYFKNKEQILMAAIDAPFVAFLVRAREAVADTTLSPEQRLRRLCRL